jgi:hypothetical protein
LRKQSEIPALLLDIQEGKRPLSDLMPHLKETDIRQQFTRKRVSPEQVREWFAKPEPEAATEGKAEPQGDATEQVTDPDAEAEPVKAAPGSFRLHVAHSNTAD